MSVLCVWLHWATSSSKPLSICFLGVWQDGFQDPHCLTRYMCKHVMPGDRMSFVGETKCKTVFNKVLSLKWARTLQCFMYITRQEDFVVLTDRFHYVSKSDGEVTPGPAIKQPPPGYRYELMEATARGIIFLAANPSSGETSYMISEPQKLNRGEETGEVVWKRVPLDRCLGRLPTYDTTKKIHSRFLVFMKTTACKHTRQWEFLILDHTGPEVVPVRSFQSIPFLQGNVALDSNYLVSHGSIFDLLQDGKSLFESKPGETPEHSISSSFICFVTRAKPFPDCNLPDFSDRHANEFKEQSCIYIWSKVAKKLVDTIPLAKDFDAHGVVILVDRIAVILGLFLDPSRGKRVLCVVDMKTSRVRYHDEEGDRNLQGDVFQRIWNKLERQDGELCLSRHNIWRELRLSSSLLLG